MEQQMKMFQEDRNLPFSVYIAQDEKFSCHCHKHMELDYCSEGHCTIKVNGESYDCQPGDFVIIHTMEDHTLIRNSDCKLLGVQMDLSVLDTAFSPFYESQYLVPFIRGSGKYQRRIRVPKGSLLESILSEILVEYQKKQPGYEMYIKGDILRLFSCLVRTKVIEIGERNVNFQDLERIKPVIDYMEQHIETELSVAAAAKIACMSYYHFCRLFKKVIGKTFVEYQNFIRIRRAEKLLITTDRTITNIAFETGFGSVAYFNRVFKKETGQAPANYRKKMRI